MSNYINFTESSTIYIKPIDSTFPTESVKDFLSLYGSLQNLIVRELSPSSPLSYALAQYDTSIESISEISSRISGQCLGEHILDVKPYIRKKKAFEPKSKDYEEVHKKAEEIYLFGKKLIIQKKVEIKAAPVFILEGKGGDKEKEGTATQIMGVLCKRIFDEAPELGIKGRKELKKVKVDDLRAMVADNEAFAGFLKFLRKA